MDFEFSLRRSLSNVNEGYQETRSDLNEIVTSLGSAVSNIAGEQFAIGLDEISSDMKGTSFRIFLDTNVTDLNAEIVDIAYLRVTSKGYPIQRGPIAKGTKTLFPEAEISSKYELSRYFVDMIENSDSALVQAIGFALRRNG
jgi:hypothetical protein